MAARLHQRRGRSPVPDHPRRHGHAILGDWPSHRPGRQLMTRGRLGAIGWIALTAAALVMVAPLVWTLLLSLKNNAELVGHSEAALHGPYTVRNYSAILGNSLTLRWLLNSAIVAVGQTAGVLVLASLAGYGF